MTPSKAKIVAVNGNGSGPQVSDPNDFPIPLEGVITVELDTGRVVKMMIGELEMLYEAGEIPNDLTGVAAKELFPPANEPEREREKRHRERLRLVKWVAGRVLVAPQIEVSHLYHDEIWQIYSLANSPARALDNFRRQQARHVGLISELQDVGTSAEPTAEGEAAAK